MTVYRHKKLSLLRVIAMMLRGFTRVLSQWPLLLIAAFFISPISPHIRWTYSYQDYGPMRTYYHCEYLGAHGLVSYRQGDNCPFFTLIEQD